jgi:predicted outer membrane protein
LQQVQPQQGQRGQLQQGQARQQVRPSGEVDQAEVAAWLILGNEAEIALGNLAFEKSQNANVREFAQTMVKDHTAFAAKLKQFIPGTVNAQPQTGDAVRPRTTAQNEAVAERHHGGMLELGRKAAGMELAMTKQMLSKYEGQDFDMGYLGQQLVAHTKMLACLTAAQDVGSPEFQKVIGEGLTTTKEHFQHAQQLAANLEDKEYGEGQRREALKPELRQPREGDIRDGGARPSIRPQDADVPREGVPQRGASDGPPPRQGTDGAPESARDREGITP